MKERQPLKRYVVESVDRIPRTKTGWTRFVGVSKKTFNSRLKKGIPFDQVVRDFRSGENQPQSYKNKDGTANRWKPCKHCVAIPEVDEVPRTIAQWAIHLDVKPLTLRKRMQNGRNGSLEAAVLSFVRNEWHTRNTSGMCKHGHEFTPENTRWVKNARGHRVRVCVTCSRHRCSIAAKKKRAALRKPKDPTMCKRGLHLRTGPGFCRECHNLYQSVRNKKIRRGVWVRKVDTRGMSLDEKIAHYSAPGEDGCRIWKGAWSGNITSPRPRLAYLRDGRTVTICVRTHVWEKKTGRRLPHRHAVSAACDNDGCIAEDHLYAEPISELARAALRAYNAKRARDAETRKKKRSIAP